MTDVENRRERAMQNATQRSVGLRLPAPEHLVFYAGIGAMALLGVMEWPVVVAIAAGHTLVNVQHNKILRSLGEALEDA